jgi:hypothetical protein
MSAQQGKTVPEWIAGIMVASGAKRAYGLQGGVGATLSWSDYAAMARAFDLRVERETDHQPLTAWDDAEKARRQ